VLPPGENEVVQPDGEEHVPFALGLDLLTLLLLLDGPLDLPVDGRAGERGFAGDQDQLVVQADRLVNLAP
jgi:hypothetical protein